MAGVAGRAHIHLPLPAYTGKVEVPESYGRQAVTAEAVFLAEPHQGVLPFGRVKIVVVGAETSVDCDFVRSEGRTGNRFFRYGSRDYIVNRIFREDARFDSTANELLT